MNYSESPKGLGTTKTINELAHNENTHNGPRVCRFSHLEEGLAYAQKNNKPTFDFTGYACINCRKIEEKVWG